MAAARKLVSFSTSATEPRTLMLHTLACRNLSDPMDRNNTRNFAELEKMLWDFDLVAKFTCSTRG